MTQRVSGASANACPTCGAVAPTAGAEGSLAWVRQLAGQARLAGPPERLDAARRVLHKLLSKPVEERHRAIQERPERYASRLVLWIAFERIEGHFPRAPRKVLEELDTVQVMAAMFDASTVEGRRFRSSAVVTTWAYRTAGFLALADLSSAKEWAEMARDLAVATPGLDRRALALLDEQEGRVRFYQQRRTEAQRLLAAAVRGYLRLGDPTTAARALLNLAEAQRQDCPDETLSTLAAAEASIDPYASPYLYLCCQMERALVLCDLGEGLAADLLVQEHREVLDEFRDIPSVPLRAAWLRGRIKLLLAAHDEAAEHFEEARRLALTQDNAYDAALVSLDLALVHLDRCDLDALHAEARAIVPILAAEGLHDAAAAALSLYRDALLRRQAGRALIHRLKAYFENARMNPGRRFRSE